MAHLLGQRLRPVFSWSRIPKESRTLRSQYAALLQNAPSEVLSSACGTFPLRPLVAWAILQQSRTPAPLKEGREHLRFGNVGEGLWGGQTRKQASRRFYRVGASAILNRHGQGVVPGIGLPGEPINSSNKILCSRWPSGAPV